MLMRFWLLKIISCLGSIAIGSVTFEGHYIYPPSSNTNITDRIHEAVVKIAAGTGFRISADGLALTNYHVIENEIRQNIEKAEERNGLLIFDPPIDCGGDFSIVAIPPNPFDRSTTWWYTSDYIHANGFLDFKRLMSNPDLLASSLNAELEFNDWALIKVGPGNFLELNTDELVPNDEVIGFGYGERLLRNKFVRLADLNAKEEAYRSVKDELPDEVFQNLLDELEDARTYISEMKDVSEENRPYILEYDGFDVVERGLWTRGKINGDGYLAQTSQLDISFYPLKLVVEPKLYTDKNNPLRGVWLSSGEKIDGILSLYQKILGLLSDMNHPPYSDELRNKLERRKRELAKRKDKDLSHAFYVEEFALIEACLTDPNDIRCKQGIQSLKDIVEKSVQIFKSDDKKEIASFIESCERSEREAQKSCPKSFNGQGFTNTLQFVSGFSGSPVVSLRTGKVLGLHRAGPFGKKNYHIPYAWAVDMRQVHKVLRENRLI